LTRVKGAVEALGEIEQLAKEALGVNRVGPVHQEDQVSRVVVVTGGHWGLDEVAVRLLLGLYGVAPEKDHQGNQETHVQFVISMF
jgi:hypothetical protein